MPLMSGHRTRTDELAYGAVSDIIACSAKPPALAYRRLLRSSIDLEKPKIPTKRKVPGPPGDLRKPKIPTQRKQPMSPAKPRKPEPLVGSGGSLDLSNGICSSTLTTPVSGTSLTVTVDDSVSSISTQSSMHVTPFDDISQTVKSESSVPLILANSTRFRVLAKGTTSVSLGEGRKDWPSAAMKTRQSLFKLDRADVESEAEANALIGEDEATTEDTMKTIEDQHPTTANAVAKSHNARSRMVTYSLKDGDDERSEHTIKSALKDTTVADVSESKGPVRFK